ncbi:MAG: hypothetical protein LBJ87_14640, partial [bacterium]|nr:hypothetical protein [bacterium]
DAFDYDPEGRFTRFDSSIVRAVSEVVRRNRHVSEARLQTTLSSRPVRNWMTQVAERNYQSKVEAIGCTLINEYNKGLRGRRLEWES